MGSSIWKNSIQGNLPGYSMVAVPDIAPVGIGGDDGFRTEATDFTHEISAENGRVLQSLVGISEEPDMADPQNGGGFPLFSFPQAGQLLRFDVRVVGSFIPVGTDDIGRAPALSDQTGHRTGGAELRVIGVRADHQDIHSSVFHVLDHLDSIVGHPGI